MSGHNHNQYYDRRRNYRDKEDRENTSASPIQPRSRQRLYGYADVDEEKNVIHQRKVPAGHDISDVMSHNEDIDRGYGDFEDDFADRVRDMLRCGICGSKFTCNGMYTPLQSWSCGHTVCQYCVLTQAHQTKTASDQHHVSCPLCEAPHAYSIHNENQQQTSTLVVNLLNLIESANANDVNMIPQSTPIRQEEFRSHRNNYDRNFHPNSNREDWRHQKPTTDEIVPLRSYSNDSATEDDDWHDSGNRDSWENSTGRSNEKKTTAIEHFPNEGDDWHDRSERDEGEFQKSCTDSNSGPSSASNSGEVATSVVSGNRRSTSMAVSRVAAYRRWNQQQKLQKHSTKSTVVAALLQQQPQQQTQQTLGILPYKPKASSEPKRRSKYLSHQKTVSDRMLSLSSHKSGGNLLEDCERAIMHNLTMSTVQDESENQNNPNAEEQYLDTTKQKLHYQEEEEEEEVHQNAVLLHQEAKESSLSRQTHQQHIHDFEEEKPQSRFYRYDENQTINNEHNHEDESHRLRFRKKIANEEPETADSFQKNNYHERNASTENKRYFSRHRTENKDTDAEEFQSHRVPPIDEQKQQTINSHSSSEIDKSKGRTQSKYISKHINHESTNTNYNSKQSAYLESSNKRYQTSPDVTAPTTVSSSVASTSFQSDTDLSRNGACYLVYDEPSGGKLQLHYSKTHLSHSLGSWTPGPSSDKKIQSFKFQQNNGRVDLIKGNDVVNKRKFFDAWCQFVKIAVTYSSILFKWDDDFKTPIDIYVHYGGGNGPVKLQCSQENGVELTKDIQAICVLPSGHRMFLGVQSMNLGVFIRQGNTSGVTMTC